MPDFAPQGSPEWHAQRLGRVTASRIADVMAEGQGGKPSRTRANYMAELIAERLTGVAYEGFQSDDMRRGNEVEPQARANYCLDTGTALVQCGFVPHPRIAMAGASPDSLVGEVGLAEFKCPKTATHLDTLRTRKIDGGYLKQMQFQLACTGRLWCDFVSFDPRLPEPMQMVILRVARDPVMIGEIEKAVTEFLRDLEMEVARLRKEFGLEAAA